ncbi:hypothetical protein [Halomonas sp. LBP4]|uniref:hypothetical protein n=1 Tax=Halomonas sp. LBP4 TaxID=2044917 RepID=UPI000D7661E7|nr:hypothetical protein [Halomonas sp. LBP4]PXX98297.1 hypothetical protein CR157_08215 [Halomonas sp. LBP4]
MDLAKIGDKVACSCKGEPHRIVSGASMAQVDGIPIAGEGVSAWPEDDFEPIGHVTFTLPMPPRRLTLQLIGGYFFFSGSGHLASGTSEIGFEIEVEAQ